MVLLLVENNVNLKGKKMPKNIEYPKASIKKSLELAKAVNELGGSAAIETCAESLGKKVSGGFRDIITSAVKYGFIVQKKGILATTDTYKNIILAYNEEEKLINLKKSFLRVPLFQKVYERFTGKKLPLQYFDKLLIKEFGVNESDASRVKKHFIDGSKLVGLLNPDNTLSSIEEINVHKDTLNHDKGPSFFDSFFLPQSKEKKNIRTSVTYTVRIHGPGIDSTVSIVEMSDLEIVKMMLDNISNKLKTKQNNKGEDSIH